MTLSLRALAPLAVFALPLAGCVAADGTARPGSAGARPQAPMAARFTTGQPLIGLDAKRLIDRFGTPRLDIRDRSVRKLQFAVGPCVLDTYLYVEARGREPVVTYIDTRRAADGADVDPSSCGIR